MVMSVAAQSFTRTFFASVQCCWMFPTVSCPLSLSIKCPERFHAQSLFAVKQMSLRYFANQRAYAQTKKVLQAWVLCGVFKTRCGMVHRNTFEPLWGVHGCCRFVMNRTWLRDRSQYLFLGIWHKPTGAPSSRVHFYLYLLKIAFAPSQLCLLDSCHMWTTLSFSAHLLHNSAPDHEGALCKDLCPCLLLAAYGRDCRQRCGANTFLLCYDVC